mgnify:CR=1 FL=1
MRNNDRYRELRNKINAAGKQSLSAVEQAEWRTLAPQNLEDYRTNPKEGNWEEIAAALDRLQNDQEAIKKELKRLAKRARRHTDL